jgi:hypothetical protein
MSDTSQKRVATVQAKGTCAWLDGLTIADNPYTVRTRLGKRWAKVWLQAFDSAQHGVTCDACSKWLSSARGYHYVYSNGFNYFLCVKCQITDVKLPELIGALH